MLIPNDTSLQPRDRTSESKRGLPVSFRKIRLKLRRDVEGVLTSYLLENDRLHM
jgi:hypothetical protein